MAQRKSRTTVLTRDEQKVFTRLRAAVGEINSYEIDIDDYCRNVARTVVAFKSRRAVA